MKKWKIKNASKGQITLNCSNPHKPIRLNKGESVELIDGREYDIYAHSVMVLFNMKLLEVEEMGAKEEKKEEPKKEMKSESKKEDDAEAKLRKEIKSFQAKSKKSNDDDEKKELKEKVMGLKKDLAELKK